MADHLLTEADDRFLLEDGSGTLLLEQQPIVTGDYLVQEADGTSRFQLEDGSGFILLESGVTPPIEVITGGGIIIPRRRLISRLEHEGFEEDEAISLAVLLALRRRHRS